MYVRDGKMGEQPTVPLVSVSRLSTTILRPKIVKRNRGRGGRQTPTLVVFRELRAAIIIFPSFTSLFKTLIRHNDKHNQSINQEMEGQNKEKF